MSHILNTQNIIAYTELNKAQYCATAQQIENADKVYIINPKGVEDLAGSGLDMVTIYVDLDEDIILGRALKRGDNLATVKARLDDEREQFDNFKARKSYDFLISTNCDLEFVYSKVDSILSTLGISKI